MSGRWQDTGNGSIRESPSTPTAAGALHGVVDVVDEADAWHAETRVAPGDRLKAYRNRPELTRPAESPAVTPITVGVRMRAHARHQAVGPSLARVISMLVG
ncbi:hypothetical protein GCM10010104_17350 [Streptomyces indiaensis]|uniref:Uncharacterized protein n=1 Tax=Streptomyces indiaensis TaxID=284033 RepID=A0ABN3DAD8_9ACTN